MVLSEGTDEFEVFNFFLQNSAILNLVADGYEGELQENLTRSLVTEARNTVIAALYDISDCVSRSCQIISDKLNAGEAVVSYLDVETTKLLDRTNSNINGKLMNAVKQNVPSNFVDFELNYSPVKAVQIKPYSFVPLFFAEKQPSSNDQVSVRSLKRGNPTLQSSVINTQIEKVVAIYDYTAVREDELSMRKGDTIFVYFKNDDNWWFGFNGTNKGFFPGNFVTFTE